MSRRSRLLVPCALAMVAGCEFDASGVNRPEALLRDARPDVIQDDAPPPPDLGPDSTITPPPDGSIPDASGCLEKHCDEGKRYCGQDVDRECLLGCNVSGTDCARFEPSNIGVLDLWRGEEALVISADSKIDTTTVSLEVGGKNVSWPTGVKYWGLTDYMLLAVTRLTIKPGATLEVVGRRPLIIAASSVIEVGGVIDCAADGHIPGPGGFFAGENHGDAEGCGGGFAGSVLGLLYVSGGTGGSNGGRGGKGGNGANPRAPCNSENLIPLRGGYGGGAGNEATDGTSPFPIASNYGGAGGGAVQLSAVESVQITTGGVINCGGGGGGSLTFNSGAGGGSGGSILVESEVVINDGVLAANGGGGGAGSVNGVGGAGEDGREDDERAKGGVANPAWFDVSTVGDGGDGSAGNEPDGKNGGTEDSGGGGGGGAGRIVIRTATGEVEGKGELSPSKTGKGLKIYILSKYD